MGQWVTFISEGQQRSGMVLEVDRPADMIPGLVVQLEDGTEMVAELEANKVQLDAAGNDDAEDGQQLDAEPQPLPGLEAKVTDDAPVDPVALGERLRRHVK